MFLLIFFLLFISGYACSGEGSGVVVYHGACDSSAAFYAGSDKFIAADDENNMLRVYSCLSGGGPEAVLDEAAAFLAEGGEVVEADIEGSAVCGELVYWIGSHGRNKSGKLRPGRQVFFATRIDRNGDELRVVPQGRVYRRLLEDLVVSDVGKELGLAKIVRFDDPSKKKLAPKRDGINIEGLTAGAEGELYIGFRNPLFDGRALVVKLVNGGEVVSGAGKCRFEGPILLDLGERGIRAMEYEPESGSVYIIAGEKDGERRFSIYRWDVKSKVQEVMELDAGEMFNPEAMFVRDGWLYLLSDDGAMPVVVGSEAECVAGEMLEDGTCPNKFLVDEDRRTFRMMKFDMKELK